MLRKASPFGPESLSSAEDRFYSQVMFNVQSMQVKGDIEGQKAAIRKALSMEGVSPLLKEPYQALLEELESAPY